MGLPRRGRSKVSTERFRNAALGELDRRRREAPGRDRRFDFEEKARVLLHLDSEIKTKTDALKSRAKQRALLLKERQIPQLKKRLAAVERELGTGGKSADEIKLLELQKSVIERELNKFSIESRIHHKELAVERLKELGAEIDELNEKKRNFAAGLMKEYGLEGVEEVERMIGGK